MRSFAAEQTSPSAKFSRGLRTATLRNEILNDNRILNAVHIRRRASAAFAKKLFGFSFEAALAQFSCCFHRYHSTGVSSMSTIPSCRWNWIVQTFSYDILVLLWFMSATWLFVRWGWQGRSARTEYPAHTACHPNRKTYRPNVGIRKKIKTKSKQFCAHHYPKVSFVEHIDQQ